MITYRKILFPILNRHYASKTTQTSTEYCLNSIKTNDYDNFMCTLLLPKEVRSCAIAVRAFNVEIAKVCEQVTQVQIGLMRLKFWEETVESFYTKAEKPVPKHPVAIELYNAVQRFKLTKRYLNTLISCRANNIDRNSFATLEDLEKYAEQSVSNVYYLMLEGCGVRNVHADHAASHLGKAQGILQQLRSTPLAKQLNLIPFPQSILTKHHVSHEDIFRSGGDQRLSDCTYEVATRSYQHLQKANNLLATVPAEGRCALRLNAVVVEEHLRRLQAVRYNAFDPRLHRRGGWLKMGWKVWWARYKQG